jgi:DNA-nicking Smr family endonuclease
LNSKISDKDKKDWENFLSDKENLPDKDAKFIKNKVGKAKTFDFHGYSLDEANKRIKDLIHEAYDQKISKLIIVTGKGLHSENEKDPYVSKDLGILKYSIPEYVKNNNELMSMINDIKNANIDDGGSGAFYIFLKKKFIK